MSQGEEGEAYTRILKFQNKRYGLGPRDVIILLIGLVAAIGGSIWLSGQTRGSYSTIIFILMTVYILLLSVAFFDYAFGFGLFNENQVLYSGVLVLITVTISIIATIFASQIFTGSSPDVSALITLVLFLLQSFIISYYILTATPTRQGRDEMIRKLTEIKNEVEKMPASKLGSKGAAERALKWLQFQQQGDGIWGEENPLYETSEVLRSFSNLNKGLGHSWVRIVNGQEEVRTVEQTYYLVLEALDTAAIEPNFEMLLPFQVVTEIDPDQVELEGEVFVDFEDELNSLSEWEFVQSLEEYDEHKSPISDIPVIFPLSIIFYLKGRLDIAQQCADIFSQTFDILNKRSQTRFNIEGEKDTSRLLLGMMYNALSKMLRGHKKVNTGNTLRELSIDDDINDSEINELDTDFDLSGMAIPDVDFDDQDEENIELDPDGPSLPSMDFEVDEDDSPSSQPGKGTQVQPSGLSSGFDISLPDPSMSLDEESNAEKPDKIKIEVSMANIRNYIRSLQAIDGSWGSSLEATATCLYAVMDQESTESEFVKLGLHYLLALQEKNGSWRNDVVLTAKILRTLIKINQSMSLGSF